MNPKETQLRQQIMEAVTLHRQLFDRLLYAQPSISRALGELLEDAGNTYLQMAESVAAEHRETPVKPSHQFNRPTG